MALRILRPLCSFRIAYSRTPCLSRAFSLHRCLSTAKSTGDDNAAAPALQLLGKSPKQQIRNFTEEALLHLRKTVLDRSFASPYHSLAKLPKARLEQLVEEFETTFSEKCSAYYENPLLHSLQLRDISLAEYFRPHLDAAPPIILLVYLNMYPTDLAEHRGYKNKTEIATAILTELFHQHCIGDLLHSLPEQEKIDTNWDIGNPAEWFPQARKMKRKIIMHVGPTNSGKTHNSLKAFAAAKSGYYAGPLRLLAREIYERFEGQGIHCNLITGEEVVPSLDEYGSVSNLSSGTIEMIPLHKKMDICIIDEIQMLADPTRGSAWTNAVLGVQAKEVHLCGEESAVALVKEMVKSTGDELLIKQYKRLGKLTMCQKPVGRLENLQKGDCLIAFSKRKILELKCRIEQSTSLKVGVIYGALPPEIRSQASAKFNSGEYDVLVASDAIGMGLNLKIKRIVFWSIMKFNGSDMVPLSVSATKQIAGRAGRFSADQGELEGLVTAFKSKDLRFLQLAMREPIKNLEKACIWPPSEFWVHYVSSFRSPLPLLEAVKKFEKSIGNRKLDNYFLSEFDHQLEILDLLLRNRLSKSLTIEDQLSLALVPLNLHFAPPVVVETALKFFECILRCESKTVFDFDFLHSSILLMEPSITGSSERVFDTLQALETNHKLVLVFMWLSQRWPTLFADKESANDIKTLIEKRISEELICLRRVAKKEKSGRRRR